MEFQRLNGDQGRELINTQQRFQTFLEARRRSFGYRGSMIFAVRNGAEYLLRDYYDPKSGVKRQRSLGRRDEHTEKMFSEFSKGKEEAARQLKVATEILRRQAAVNRALEMGRVPEIGAKIIRALDGADLLGKGLTVVGTNALFAYEASAGVRFPSDITTTEDIDLLFDARVHMRLAADEDAPERTLLGILKKVDRSFRRSDRVFQAINGEGYLVDLIKPMRDPPWTVEASSVSGESSDLEAVQIAGLAWHENAPQFEAVALDARGFPVRIIAPDPRAYVVHKQWLSERPDRNILKRDRDAAQARWVAALIVAYMPNLPFDSEMLRSFPKSVVESARPLFEMARSGADTFEM
ncbi:hypothetical protein FJ958_19125 [Mesorhizobium sp. B2-3-5]|nr:hypothetical protein FJ958_19125 [Mesorhizobium sp. B2-3-5]